MYVIFIEIHDLIQSHRRRKFFYIRAKFFNSPHVFRKNGQKRVVVGCNRTHEKKLFLQKFKEFILS